MSFLNQLKSQAQALQGLRTADDLRLGERTDQTHGDRTRGAGLRRRWPHAPAGAVRVNFPTDMRRVEERLAHGPVKYQGFEVMQTDLAAARVDAVLLDELAKRIVGQPSLFV